MNQTRWLPGGKSFGLAVAAPPQAPATDPKYRISGVAATVVAEPDSGRRYTVLEIATEAGLKGYGEAAPLPGETLPAAAGQLRDALVRQDARAAVVLDDRLRADAGRLAGRLRGAVNMALLDILGRAAEAPLYEVLGGPTRNKLRAMAVVEGETPEAVREAVLSAWRAGFRAFSTPLLMPAGPTRGRAFYRQAREQLESLRAATGEDADFVLDCGGRTTPAEALSLATELEAFHLLWLDEPSARVSAEALRALSDGAVTPAGYGRSFDSKARFQDLLALDGIDVLRPDIAGWGVTEIRKVASLAEVYYVAIAPFHRGGPIATAAALHAAASLPNFFIQETPFPLSARDRRMRERLAGVALETPSDGFFALPPGPGLGVEVAADALQEHAAKNA